MSDFGDSQWQRRDRPPWSWPRRILVLGPAAVILLWFGGFLHFTTSLPRAVADRDLATDAIVVLTGGAGRLDVGLGLLRAGKAGKMLISGVEPGTTAGELRAGHAGTADTFRCCVELGHRARDTRGNAVEAALWMRRGGHRSLRLVTSSYHMPRSLLLFRQAMPDVLLVANPVFPPHVKLDGWWFYPGSARLLMVEYSKFLVSLLSVRLVGVSTAE
ncbi:MAG: YdcF family protein [Alphaproteobacteria bacterium]|nr:YdcF family protein [Alphaproteobacteria bacterium]